MIWLKAMHVVAMVTWFAGLFYLPRLFVYHADTKDNIGSSRFKVMERRLFALMCIGAALTVGLGLAMVFWNPAYLAAPWLRIKLAIVTLLIAYHGYCYRLMLDFRNDRNQHSARWFRAFNEAPSIALLAIVTLAVVKPF